MDLKFTKIGEAAFTIVEILVASAILFVLALAVATLMYNASTQQTKTEDRAKSADLVQGAALDMRMRPVPSPT